MILLEVSVVVFLLQGYRVTGKQVGVRGGGPWRGARHAGHWGRAGLVLLLLLLPLGRVRTSPTLAAPTMRGGALGNGPAQALVRTLCVAAAVAAFDLAVKLVYIFGLHVPLFLFG